MRCLRRNLIPFWYCRYAGKEEIFDSDGFATGDYRVIYDVPVRIMGNISPARGNVGDEPFGGDIRYDKVIALDDPGCPIDEDTVLFLDKEPEYGAGGDPLFDYVVRRAARSLNSVLYAAEKVSLS